MATNNIVSDLVKSVTLATELLRSKVSEKLSSGNYPSELKENVKSYPVEQKGEIISGKVEIKGAAVLAYEFGSGIWSERGPREKYPIVPENASMLAFDWPAAKEAAAFSREGVELVIPRGERGHVVLPRVMHPGIRPQPFAQPAVDESADMIADMVASDFLVAFSTAIGPDEVVIS